MQFTSIALTIVGFCIWECFAAGESALEIAPSQYFDGNDGPWSSFFLRVGTPEQDVRVLVSTASPESLVVLANAGCSTSAFAEVPSDCATSRGALYDPSESSTWQELGYYGINGEGVGLEANLGYSTNAQFAYETIGIGLAGPSLGNQTFAGIGTAYPFYLGIFGLNNQPVNLSSLGNGTSPSFLTSLKDQDMIPSLSWSYTAGAMYRLKQVFGQLIFSGYDTSRFTENSVTFTMRDDVTRDLIVVLQSISYTGSDSAVLLSDPINIFIDSTDPNLWLPDDVVDAFEEAFGLVADNTTGMYLVNDTQHELLLNSDAEVTFRLSDVSEGGDTVTITLPYNAFDLKAEYPLVANTSYYFPLKRAANETQYTLGRTFLQEAYLSVDYERQTFNVSACTWVEGAVETIITIPSKDDEGATSTSSPSGGSSLGGGAIAGIVIGAVVFAILVGTLIYLLIRRHRKKTSYAVAKDEPDVSAIIAGPVHNAPPTPGPQKYYSPETVGNGTTLASGSHAGGSGAGSDSERNGGVSSTDPGTEISNDTPRELHAVSMQPPERVETPTYHELGGSEVRRTGSGRLAAMRSSSPPPPLPSQVERGEEPESALVSTMDSSGWRDERGDGASDLVSPTTPTHHGFARASIVTDLTDRS
ncbi:acid protease [Xylariomycetidae sp. FL2044]|nr:acid protease [Xylariomycetidae sp. FL2044]